MDTLTFPSHSCPSTFHTPQIPKNSQSTATLLLSIPHFRTRLSFKMSSLTLTQQNQTKYQEKKQTIRLDCAQRALLTCTLPRAELNCSSAVAWRVLAMVTASPPRSTCRSCPACVSRMALLSLVKPLMTMMASPAMTDQFLCWKIKRDREQRDKMSRTSLQQVSWPLRAGSRCLENLFLLWKQPPWEAVCSPESTQASLRAWTADLTRKGEFSLLSSVRITFQDSTQISKLPLTKASKDSKCR